MSGADRVVAVIPPAPRRPAEAEAGAPLLACLAPGVRVWDALAETLAPHVDAIHVVLDAGEEDAFVAALDERAPCAPVTTSACPASAGFGDALFSAADHFGDAAAICVVEPASVLVSDRTLRESLRAQRSGGLRCFALPVARPKAPRAAYRFDWWGALEAVHESVEGEDCEEGGCADVGVFVLAAEGLLACWEAYRAEATPGPASGEIGFRPFLPYLSLQCGWLVERLDVEDVDEARGAWTPEDLAFCAARLDARGRLARPGGPTRG